MRWQDKRLIGVSTLGLLIGGCGLFGNMKAEAKGNRQILAPSSQTPAEEQVLIGDPYTIGGERFEPKDDNSFDEVGYASVRSSGSDNSGISASHRILPIPSYVEITNLETGKTILVRINERGPMLKNRVVDLSPAAAQTLGIGGGQSTAVRVRRVNPPSSEKSILRSGNAAPERLDTPPALLSALKKQLNETGPAKPREDEVATPTAPKPLPKLKPIPKVAVGSAPTPAIGAPGATFDVPAPSSLPPRMAKPVRPTAKPVRVAMPAPQPTPQIAAPVEEPTPAQESITTGQKSDRFIIEDGNGGRFLVKTTGQVRVIQGDAASEASSGESTAVAAPEPTQTASNPYYVQIGSFGDKGRATALASRAGGSLARAGRLWHVVTGPYSDEGAARAGLSQAISKGYRDARISR